MGRRAKYGDEHKAEIISMYSIMKMSLNAIARKLDLHPQVIKRKLQKYGYGIRDLSESMKIFHEKRKDCGKYAAFNIQ